MNRIEAVTVCVDYADYLEETLPFLLPHVDDLVVVTTPEDGRTRQGVRPAWRALPADPLLLSRGRCLQQGPGDQLRPGQPQAGRLGAPYRRGHRIAAAHAVLARQHGSRPSQALWMRPGQLRRPGRVGRFQGGSRGPVRVAVPGQAAATMAARRADRPHGAWRILPDRLLPVVVAPGFGRLPLSPGVPGDGRAFRRAPCHPVGPRGSLPDPRIDLRPPGNEGQG